MLGIWMCKMKKVLYVDFEERHCEEFREIFGDVDTVLSIDGAVDLVDKGKVYDVVVIDAKIKGRVSNGNGRIYPCENLADYIKKKTPDVTTVVVNNGPICGAESIDRILRGSSFVYMEKEIKYIIENA